MTMIKLTAIFDTFLYWKTSTRFLDWRCPKKG